jgi:hypothetical protein
MIECNPNMLFRTYRKTITFLLFALFSIALPHSSNAQITSEDSLSVAQDFSALRNDTLLAELRLLLDSMGQQGSFFSVTTSVSNRLFSTKNNAFNSQQTNSGVTAFMPSVAYFHKTGLGLSATGYIRTIEGAPAFYQMALSPSYDKIGKKVIYGISYSYYLKQQDLASSVTPYSHELYAYVQEKKLWLKPALAAGWAAGKYDDISRTVVTRFGIPRLVVDTSEVQLKDLSLSASISHSFSFAKVFSKKGLLAIVPQFSLIGGIQYYATTSKSLIRFDRTREEELRRVRRLYRVSSSSSSTMSLQTAAFSTNVSWYKGAFSISSGYFFGYYFDSSASSRFSHIFNVSLGFTF